LTVAAVATAGLVVYENRAAVAGSLRSLQRGVDWLVQQLLLSERSDDYRAWLNGLKRQLDDRNIAGARRDLQGNPIRRLDGRAWDHLTKVRQAQTGLLNLIDRLKSELQRRDLTKEEREELERMLGEASRLLDWTVRQVGK
jgi:hypothetical protein